MIRKDGVKVIGFDIDGTLYQEDESINDRIRNEIAVEILKIKPDYLSVENARAMFEERYLVLNSGRKILDELGVKNSSEVIDDCIARANILDLILPDERLIEMLERLSKRYELGVVTSNTTEMSRKKLERLGLRQGLFNAGVYRDGGIFIKSEGTAFMEYLNKFPYDPSAHVYVGNSLKADIVPANNLGIQTVAVWNELPEATTSIRSIYDLEKIL